MLFSVEAAAAVGQRPLSPLRPCHGHPDGRERPPHWFRFASPSWPMVLVAFHVLVDPSLEKCQELCLFSVQLKFDFFDVVEFSEFFMYSGANPSSGV